MKILLKSKILKAFRCRLEISQLYNDSSKDNPGNNKLLQHKFKSKEIIHSNPHNNLVFYHNNKNNPQTIDKPTNRLTFNSTQT